MNIYKAYYKLQQELFKAKQELVECQEHLCIPVEFGKMHLPTEPLVEGQVPKIGSMYDNVTKIRYRDRLYVVEDIKEP